jgi:hypothetical protein
LINSQSGTLPSNDDLLGCGDAKARQHTREHHHAYNHTATSLSSDRVPTADYGLFGISQSLEQEPNEARVVGRDMQLQDTPAAEFLSQNTTFGHDAMHFQQTSSEISGSRYADMVDPFSGYDIPFWFEQDQYWDIFQNFD